MTGVKVQTFRHSHAHACTRARTRTRTHTHTHAHAPYAHLIMHSICTCNSRPLKILPGVIAVYANGEYYGMYAMLMGNTTYMYTLLLKWMRVGGTREKKYRGVYAKEDKRIK